MTTPAPTPLTDAWQDADWEECGNNNDFKRMLLAYDHCRELERALAAERANMEDRNMEIKALQTVLDLCMEHFPECQCYGDLPGWIEELKKAQSSRPAEDAERPEGGA